MKTVGVALRSRSRWPSASTRSSGTRPVGWVDPARERAGRVDGGAVAPRSRRPVVRDCGRRRDSDGRTTVPGTVGTAGTDQDDWGSALTSGTAGTIQDDCGSAGGAADASGTIHDDRG